MLEVPSIEELHRWRDGIQAYWCTHSDDELEVHMTAQVQSFEFAPLWQRFEMHIACEYNWLLVTDEDAFREASRKVEIVLNHEWRGQRPHVMDANRDNIEYACAIMSIVYLIHRPNDENIGDMGEFIYEIIERGLRCRLVAISSG